MATAKLQSGGRTGKLAPSMTGRLAERARRLGEMLLEFNTITPDQLQEALEEQRRTNERLGEILVRFGLLTSAELEELLARQQRDWPVDPTVVRQKLGEVLQQAAQKKLLGQILVDFHRITPRQLEQALAEQDRTNERLGQVMVRLGMLEQQELDAVLMLQSGELPAPPGQIRRRLGEILLASRTISREQLEEALRQQRFSRKQIGQILLEAGYICEADLNKALTLQGRMATASLVAAMSVVTLSGFGQVAPPAPLQPRELNTAVSLPLPSWSIPGLQQRGIGPASFPSLAPAGHLVGWVSRIEKEVSRKPVGQEIWMKARVNDPLAPGDQVQTGRGARAELTFGDGTVLRLSQSTVWSQAADPGLGYWLFGKLWLHIPGNRMLRRQAPGIMAGHDG